MTIRLFFVLLFWLSACRAQQPTPAPQVTKTEIKKTEVEEKKVPVQEIPKKKVAYNLFLMLPVDLSAAFTLDSIVIDSSYVSEAIDKDIKTSIDFYEGALLAIDSLRHAGEDVKLKVFDLPGNDEQQISAIWKINFSGCDMVFSMLRGKPLSTLNGILRTKNIPLVSCAPNSFSQVEKNKNAYCVQPSSLTQCKLIGEFAATNFKSDIIIIVTASTDKEQERAHSFSQGIEKNNPEALIKKVNLALEGKNGFNKALVAGATNTIFIPSTDEDFVTTAYAAVDSALEIYRFKIIGLPVWQYFESIDPRTMEKFNTLIFSPDDISFGSPVTVKFREKFRHYFNTEPGDGAYLAYDSFLLFWNQISMSEMEKLGTKLTGIRSSYNFIRQNPEGAVENQLINVLKLMDYRFVKIN
jgi:ABC-type branched-subunit amino acid transport system substrate-binding protein